jgi:hypothetical protein
MIASMENASKTTGWTLDLLNEQGNSPTKIAADILEILSKCKPMYYTQVQPPRPFKLAL